MMKSMLLKDNNINYMNNSNYQYQLLIEKIKRNRQKIIFNDQYYGVKYFFNICSKIFATFHPKYLYYFKYQ